MNSWLTSLLIAGIPILALIGTIHFSAKQRARRIKTPFTGKLLRPPGESLREELMRLDDKMAENIIAFMGMCAWLGVSVYNVHFQGRVGFIIGTGALFLIGYGACIYFAARIFRLGRLRRDYNLGFLGERAVGEELNRMMAKGYEVYHDVQFEGRPGAKNFNIDHVIVGPGGIFSVETKTRRKQVKKGSDSPRNIVEFDGNRLTFPWGSDDFGIKQARENAAHLRGWLQQAVGNKIEVIPILALPGWSVDRKGKGDVRVVSGREISSAFPATNSKAVLAPDLIKRISFQLEQRCRNVEVE